MERRDFLLVMRAPQLGAPVIVVRVRSIRNVSMLVALYATVVCIDRHLNLC